MKLGLRGADAGGAGGAEGDDSLSAEVVPVQEGQDHARNLSIPDREADQHDVIIGIGKRGVDLGTGGSGPILLLIGTGRFVIVVAVVARVGFGRGDLVEVRAQDAGHGFGDALGRIGEGEVGDEDLLRAQGDGRRTVDLPGFQRHGTVRHRLLSSFDGFAPVEELNGEAVVRSCGNGEVEVHRGCVPGEVGRDGLAASCQVLVGREPDCGGFGRDVLIGDAQDGCLV